MLRRLHESNTVQSHVYIRTVQIEMIKFIFKQCNRVTISLVELKCNIVTLLRSLIREKRLDIIEYLFHQPLLKYSCQKKLYIRQWIDVMLETSDGRHTLDTIMNYPAFKSLVSQKDFLFVLVDKKEEQYLEKLLEISPNLINELDDDGNNPLLHITLKISNHRHRIIEMLLKYGCDVEKKIVHGQRFRSALQLQNRRLLESLIEYKIINGSKF